MKKLGIALLVLALLVVAAGFAAPGLIARGIEIGFERILGVSAAVDLEAYPSLRLLLGRFDSLTIVTNDVPLGGIQAREYRVVLEQVGVNLRSLLFNRELVFSEPGEMQVTIVISEAELTRYLWAQIPLLEGWQLLINPDEILISGKANILNSQLDAVIRGGLSAVDGDKVHFAVRSVELQGVTVPAELAVAAFLGSEFYIDLSEAPVPLQLSEVRLEAGQLVLIARALE
ncbi:MAG TPA: DUF2993 domain-containing protein [Bacillota bacterium]|nr:DUF2993 domain-containing protein [Bacillota bacterium]